MQIDRLFQIVYILLNKKSVTAKYLSEKFEVSQRTIYRDIDTLCDARIPIYTIKEYKFSISSNENTLKMINIKINIQIASYFIYNNFINLF